MIDQRAVHTVHAHKGPAAGRAINGELEKRGRRVSSPGDPLKGGAMQSQPSDQPNDRPSDRPSDKVNPTDRIEALIARASQNDDEAWKQLFTEVYPELRRVASHIMKNESPGQTNTPTAVVHEIYFRLANQLTTGWKDRRHFFNCAAQAMRRLMLDRAKLKAREKHGGGRKRQELDDVSDKVPIAALEHYTLENAAALDAAMDELEKLNPQYAEIVRLRYFAGLTTEQTAEILGVAARTVRGDFKYAKACLKARVTEAESLGKAALGSASDDDDSHDD